jgi:OPA family glycerol-3-phosphate transporter-like MFS transporter 1/2
LSIFSQGVVEFSTALFFVKLVGYTFLFWLPSFIKGAGTPLPRCPVPPFPTSSPCQTDPPVIFSGVNITSTGAAFVSITFDVGGVLGGAVAGLIADGSGKSATTCVVMILLAIPVVRERRTGARSSGFVG